ncbi:hypothetical protein BGZ73_002973 [Actinomortierella ambigua]|nr:hypothetical protein BGZ73_002973 [Actinomortierella ambigua]
MSSNDPAESLDSHGNYAAPVPVTDDDESKDRSSIKLMEVHLTSVPVSSKDDARLGVGSTSSSSSSSSGSPAGGNSNSISSNSGTAAAPTSISDKPSKAAFSPSSSDDTSASTKSGKPSQRKTATATATESSASSSYDLAWPETGSDQNDDPAMDASDDGSSDRTESAPVEEEEPSNNGSSKKKKTKDTTTSTSTSTTTTGARRPLSHYETREERLVRIRKQFSPLNQTSSQDDNGFLDANSLVGFFADISPDESVQRRYADELLQLCHSRKLRRSSSPRPRSTAKTKGGAGGSGRSKSVTGAGAGVTGGAAAALAAGSAVSRNGEEGEGDEDSSSIDLSSLSSEAGIEASVESDGVVDTTGGSMMSEDAYDHGDEDAKPSPRVLYSDFQIFVEEKEERLWNLFQEIDHNNDQEIQPEELQASLAKAGIHLSDRDLEQFVKAIDKDGNGVIDYDEWRDFLVLLPRETTLKEIYKYVQEVIAQVGVDGDVVIPPSDHEYVFKYLLAGAIAGAVSRTVTAPLDRLKVYLITNSAVSTLTGPNAVANLKNIPKFSSNLVRQPPQQRLLWSAIMDLYHQGGIRTFFRGNGLNIVKIAPESAIKFYMYETSKWMISTHLPSLTNSSSAAKNNGGNGNGNGNGTPEISTAGRFLAGGIAGLASQFSIYPLETIKTRIMSSTGKSQNSQVRLCISSVGKEIWQRAGIKGFYRGLGASLVGIFPYAAIDLSVFETLKFGYMKWRAKGSPDHDKLERPSVFVLLACGTISGSVGATTVYPLSLVRTRLQAQGTPQHPQTYSSTLDVFRKTYQQDGIRGFYKGMVPTLTKVVPAVSISYVVYEYSKQKLGLDR